MNANPFKHLAPAFWETATRYIGTKELDAIPMTRGEYNAIRNWAMPEDENPDDGGYIVRYQDGYVSWSPEMTFDMAYGPLDRLSFGDALHFLKDGKKLARAGWNGKGMWIMLVPGTEGVELRPGSPYAKALKDYVTTDGFMEQVAIGSHIDMFTAQGIMQPGWLASQPDMLANDWGLVS